uniref:Uncharacterized protein n=1 Tax=Glossina pallidipes TaxID=7398 RepID=A0A1A9Z0R9_GLOPL
MVSYLKASYGLLLQYNYILCSHYTNNNNNNSNKYNDWQCVSHMNECLVNKFLNSSHKGPVTLRAYVKGTSDESTATATTLLSKVSLNISDRYLLPMKLKFIAFCGKSLECHLLLYEQTEDLKAESLNRQTYRDKSKMSNFANEVEKQLVNEAVEHEMERIKCNWKICETNYIENMLEEESNYNESLCRDLRRKDNISDIKINPDDDFLPQRQKERAKASRHFRVNRRIKKAKLKYRFQYVTNKLLEGTDMLERVHDLIGEAERKLTSQGFSKDKIEILRKCFDVDEAAEILNNIKEW